MKFNFYYLILVIISGILFFNACKNNNIQIEEEDPKNSNTELHWQLDMYNIAEHSPANPLIINVSSQTELESAISGATAGHRIRIASGTYEGFTLNSRNGTEKNRIIIEAADFDNPPIFTSRLTLRNCRYIILYRLRFNNVDGALKIGINESGELQNFIHIARCIFSKCDLNSISMDRRTSDIEIRNNYFGSGAQTDQSNPQGNTIIFRDGRPGISDAPENWAFRARIEHNVMVQEGTLNQISGPRTGHGLYDQTSRYCGCVDQLSTFKYNYIMIPRKYTVETKAGGWEFVGNYFGRTTDAKGNNATFGTRQTSDEAPHGTGHNVYKGNVYDGLLEVYFMGTGGGGKPHYMNGDWFINGSRCNLYCETDAGAHGNRPPHRMRMDFVWGETINIGFSYETPTGPLNGIELHQCKFSKVNLLTQTNTKQSGLTEKEVKFPTYRLQQKDVGPEAFSPDTGK